MGKEDKGPLRILTLGGRMLTAALIEQGHEVMHVGPPGTTAPPLDREMDFFGAPDAVRNAVRDAAETFQPHWILQVDDSTPLAHAGLESLPFPTAWYAVDSHLHLEWHRHFAPLFDMVFCAQKNRLQDLQACRGQGLKAVWLPLAASTSAGFAPWAERAWDVAFVGTLDPALNPARTALLDGLKARGQAIHLVQGDFRPVFPASRVVFNQSVGDDLNLRCFEAMAMGALLLTDRISHSLEDIGVPGTDFLVYARGDAEDLHAKIAWALAHPAESEAIARRGHAKVLQSHLLRHRVATLTAALETSGRGLNPAAGPPLRRLGLPLAPPSSHALPLGHRLAHLAAAHEHLSRLSLPPHLSGFFAGESRRLALAALDQSPREPYALLTLAQLDFERGGMGEALAWLDRAASGEGVGPGSEMGVEAGVDPGYLRRYATLRALLLAHAGRVNEARRTALEGLRRFPGDADLDAIGRALGLSVPGL